MARRGMAWSCILAAYIGCHSELLFRGLLTFTVFLFTVIIKLSRLVLSDSPDLAAHSHSVAQTVPCRACVPFHYFAPYHPLST